MATATDGPTQSISPQASHSATALALGVSLAVLATLVFGALGFYFVRRRYRQRKTRARAEEIHAHRRTYMVAVDPTHLAARVTPFGVGVNAPDVQMPKFVHNPGENMRVAHRRSDGGWSFHASEECGPGGSVDLQREPTTLTMFSTRTTTKEKKMRPGELTTRGYIEPDVEGNPPPAYYDEPSVYSKSSAAGV